MLLTISVVFMVLGFSVLLILQHVSLNFVFLEMLFSAYIIPVHNFLSIFCIHPIASIQIERIARNTVGKSVHLCYKQCTK